MKFCMLTSHKRQKTAWKSGEFTSHDFLNVTWNYLNSQIRIKESLFMQMNYHEYPCSSQFMLPNITSQFLWNSCSYFWKRKKLLVSSSEILEASPFGARQLLRVKALSSEMKTWGVFFWAECQNTSTVSHEFSMSLP